MFVKVRLSFGRILLKYPLRQSIKIALSFPSLLHLVPQFDAVWDFGNSEVECHIEPRAELQRAAGECLSSSIR